MGDGAPPHPSHPPPHPPTLQTQNPLRGRLGDGRRCAVCVWRRAGACALCLLLVAVVHATASTLQELEEAQRKAKEKLAGRKKLVWLFGFIEGNPKRETLKVRGYVCSLERCGGS